MLPDLSDILQIAAISGIAVALLGAVCAISVATYRSVKRIDRTALPSYDTLERLAQLQQSVDAIAVEVERIAEAQRFTARLEAQRENAQSLPTSR
jgi:hypothetical protein